TARRLLPSAERSGSSWHETLISRPLQSYSIVAPVQEWTYRDHYRIAASAIVRLGRAKYTVISVHSRPNSAAPAGPAVDVKILKRTWSAGWRRKVIGQNRNRPDNSADPIARSTPGGSEAAYRSQAKELEHAV